MRHYFAAIDSTHSLIRKRNYSSWIKVPPAGEQPGRGGLNGLLFGAVCMKYGSDSAGIMSCLLMSLRAFLFVCLEGKKNSYNRALLPMRNDFLILPSSFPSQNNVHVFFIRLYLYFEHS